MKVTGALSILAKIDRPFYFSFVFFLKYHLELQNWTLYALISQNYLNNPCKRYRVVLRPCFADVAHRTHLTISYISSLSLIPHLFPFPLYPSAWLALQVR